MSNANTVVSNCEQGKRKERPMVPPNNLPVGKSGGIRQVKNGAPKKNHKITGREMFAIQWLPARTAGGEKRT